MNPWILIALILQPEDLLSLLLKNKDIRNSKYVYIMEIQIIKSKNIRFILTQPFENKGNITDSKNSSTSVNKGRRLGNESSINRPIQILFF